MAKFEIAYAPLKRYEGGYSDHPNDRGGETYAGIARNYFPNWEGWKIVDQQKKSTAKSGLTKALSKIPALRTLVEDWYRREWWDCFGLSDFPQELADEIFEQAVNLGKAGCGKKIQTICNAFNRDGNGQPLFADLTLDGAIGPKTIAAMKTILKTRASDGELVHALNCMQGAHYLELACKRPGDRAFTKGWMKRTYDA